MKKILLIFLVLILAVGLAACQSSNNADSKKSTATKYTLAINKVGEGTVEPAEGTYKYEEDTVVDLKVTADTANGWHFSGWSGVDGDEVSQNKILINGDKSLTAVFSKSEYTMNITVTPQNAGTVETVTLPSLQSIEHGETVRLTANSNPGYIFDHWEEDLSGNNDNPVTLEMDSDKNITAVFEKGISGSILGINNSQGYEGIKVEVDNGTTTTSTTTDSSGRWLVKDMTGDITITPQDSEKAFETVFYPGSKEVSWPVDNIDFFFEGYVNTLSWGSEGSDEGQFHFLSHIVMDNRYDNLYVADAYNNRIQVFDEYGNFINEWGSEGSADGQFNKPHGIAVDSNGYIYVADTKNNRIQKFDENGNFVTKWGSPGTGDSEFDNPSDIAIDPGRNVYVVDSRNNRIQKFDEDGNYITEWGGTYGTADGQFKYPDGIAVDDSFNVYVSDTGNDRIQKFDSVGNFISKWGVSGSGEGQLDNPLGILVDDSGDVYVVENYNDSIVKYDSSGNFVTQWNGFDNPYGITIDENGNIYVSDSGHYLIKKIVKVD